MANRRKAVSRERIFQIVAMATLPAIILAGVVLVVSLRGSGESDPYAGHSLYTNPSTAAADYARQLESTTGLQNADAEVFSALAEQPTATWLVPERQGIGQVGSFVSSITADAARENALPVFVIYGIPDRDCTAGESAGGLASDEYRTWISEIGAALTGSPSVVIIEPDALALAIECDNADERVETIGDVVDVMDAAGVTAYIDAGHSNWRSPEEIADLLTRAGVDRVRGFSTNVSNFNTTAEERAYADALSSLTGNAHYVIDTSRNGRGSNGEWCNPAGRALGEAPAISGDDSPLDATLWIKVPGESDGTCNGGPKAGEWWPDYALDLASRAGW